MDNREELKKIITEKAVSVSQRNFMGMVDAYKKGDMPDASPAIKKAAKSMTKKEVKDFAKTKHKGLPNHVDESTLREIIRESLKEISNKAIGRYMRATQDQRRERQYNSGKWHAIETVNKKYSFTTKLEYGEEIAFSLGFENGQFIILADVDEHINSKETYTYKLIPEHPRRTLDGTQITDTVVGYAIDNLRAGERMKLNGLCQSAMELNKNLGSEPINETLNEISDDTVDSAYMKALADTNKYGYDDPMGVRRRVQAANLKKMRDERLGFDPVAMTAKMRQNGTSGDPSIDRRWSTWQKNHNDRVAGKRTYDKDKARWITKQLEEKINESVQTELVKVLGKYTQGKATSEQANKAIMNLANSSNNKINESIEDEMKVWDERDKSPFGQILKQLQTIAEDCLIDAGDAMSSIRTVYALDGNEAVTVKRVKRCLSEYDIILLDDEGNVDIENSNSHEAAELVYKLSNLAPNGLNESKIDDYQETHFAVNKNTGKIVNGWDYRGYDPEELRQFKRDYFIQDLLDNDLDPKQYVILNKATCIRRGINPDDSSNWANA